MAFLIGGANSAADTGYDIENSVRYNQVDSPELYFTPSSDMASRRTMTWSWWCKRGKLNGTGSYMFVMALDDEGVGFNPVIRFNDSGGGDTIRFTAHNESTPLRFITNASFRDLSAWYNFVIMMDTTQSTNTNRLKFYINGVQTTSFSEVYYGSQDDDTNWGKGSRSHDIGFMDTASESATAKYFDGYLADFYYINAQNLTPSAFGETNDNGIWVPKKYEGTYNSDSFFLEFKNINPILGDAAGRHKIAPTNGATFNTSIKKFGSSSLYLDNTDNYLNVTNNLADFGFGACNSVNWTVEFWVYKLTNSSSGSDFIVYGDNNSFFVNYRPGDPQFKVNVGGTEYAFGNNSPALSNTTWTHIAVVNEGGTLKIYKDGTVDGTTHDISSKTVSTPNNLYIGYSDADTFDGYIDELRISNTARYTGNFSVATSVFDVDSNTKLLLHMDTDPSIGTDSSGEGNHMTSANLTINDQCTDTPTNNFATMKIHGAAAVSGAVLAEGNLKCTTGTSGSGRDLGRIFISNILMSSGKWYWEAKMADTVFQIGLSAYQGSRLGNTTNNTRFLVLNSNGELSDKADSSESQDTYMASVSADDIVQFALDMDASPKVIYFGKGGLWGDGSGNTDESSPNSAVDISGGAHDILTDTTDNEGFIGVSFHSSGGGSTSTAEINFGNPSFSISSGNADANGYGNFEYAVPSGYYALCTKNLAEYG